MGLNNFILECEKDNKNLRKDIEYYKNKANRVEQQLNLYKSVIDEVREEIIKWYNSNGCALDDYYFKEKALEILDKVKESK